MGKPKGFAVTAARDPEAHRELARRGGRAAHVAGTGHEFTSDEAREAGRKGGRASWEAKARRRAEEAAATQQAGSPIQIVGRGVHGSAVVTISKDETVDYADGHLTKRETKS